MTLSTYLSSLLHTPSRPQSSHPSSQPSKCVQYMYLTKEKSDHSRKYERQGVDDKKHICFDFKYTNGAYLNKRVTRMFEQLPEVIILERLKETVLRDRFRKC
jgi:hypothetical protein